MEFKMRYQDVMLKRLWAIGVIVLLATLFGFNNEATAQDAEEPRVEVGALAPALDIEQWFSDRDGEFERTTKFKSGKIYVVSFIPIGSWQSRLAISRCAILQDQYVNKGVQIICVGNEDEDTVADFLELEVSDRPEMIYAELAMHFCLTSDPDRSVYDQYVGREKPFGPLTFIVGKDGFVEWIGDSTKMQSPLKKIMAGKWDRDAVVAAAALRKELRLKSIEINELYEAEDLEAALKLINEILAKPVEGPIAEELAQLRVDIMLILNTGDIAAAVQAVADNHWDESYELNKVSWAIVLHHQAGNKIAPELLEVATNVSRRAAKIARESGSDSHKGAVLDTLAHLIFMGGDFEQAFEIQTEAVGKSQDKEVTDYFAELKKIKALRDAEAREVEAAAREAEVKAAEAKGAEGKNSEAESAPQTEVESESQPSKTDPVETTESKPTEAEQADSESELIPIPEAEEADVER